MTAIINNSHNHTTITPQEQGDGMQIGPAL